VRRAPAGGRAAATRDARRNGARAAADHSAGSSSAPVSACSSLDGASATPARADGASPLAPLDKPAMTAELKRMRRVLLESTRLDGAAAAPPPPPPAARGATTRGAVAAALRASTRRCAMKSALQPARSARSAGVPKPSRKVRF